MNSTTASTRTSTGSPRIVAGAKRHWRTAAIACSSRPEAAGRVAPEVHDGATAVMAGWMAMDAAAGGDLRRRTGADGTEKAGRGTWSCLSARPAASRRRGVAAERAAGQEREAVPGSIASLPVRTRDSTSSTGTPTARATSAGVRTSWTWSVLMRRRREGKSPASLLLLEMRAKSRSERVHRSPSRRPCPRWSARAGQGRKPSVNRSPSRSARTRTGRKPAAPRAVTDPPAVS